MESFWVHFLSALFFLFVVIVALLLWILMLLIQQRSASDQLKALIEKGGAWQMTQATGALVNTLVVALIATQTALSQAQIEELEAENRATEAEAARQYAAEAEAQAKAALAEARAAAEISPETEALLAQAFGNAAATPAVSPADAPPLTPAENVTTDADSEESSTADDSSGAQG